MVPSVVKEASDLFTIRSTLYMQPTKADKASVFQCTVEYRMPGAQIEKKTSEPITINLNCECAGDGWMSGGCGVEGVRVEGVSGGCEWRVWGGGCEGTVTERCTCESSAGFSQSFSAALVEDQDQDFRRYFEEKIG